MLAASIRRVNRAVLSSWLLAVQAYLKKVGVATAISLQLSRSRKSDGCQAIWGNNDEADQRNPSDEGPSLTKPAPHRPLRGGSRLSLRQWSLCLSIFLQQRFLLHIEGMTRSKSQWQDTVTRPSPCISQMHPPEWGARHVRQKPF